MVEIPLRIDETAFPGQGLQSGHAHGEIRVVTIRVASPATHQPTPGFNLGFETHRTHPVHVPHGLLTGPLGIILITTAPCGQLRAKAFGIADVGSGQGRGFLRLGSGGFLALQFGGGSELALGDQLFRTTRTADFMFASTMPASPLPALRRAVRANPRTGQSRLVSVG